jgi:hypothetical protein
MFPTVSTAVASYWAKQFELCSAFNAKALASMTKLSELNMHTIQGALENSSKAMQQLSSDQPSASDQAQLAIDAARAYGKQVAGIAFDMRTESTHLMQNSISAVHAQVDSYIADLTKEAPDAASGALQLVRTAIGNANKGYDQLMMTSEQAAQAVVDSLNGDTHPIH